MPRALANNAFHLTAGLAFARPPDDTVDAARADARPSYGAADEIAVIVSPISAGRDIHEFCRRLREKQARSGHPV